MKKYKVVFSLSGPGINFMEGEEFEEKRYSKDVLEMAIRSGAVKEIKEETKKKSEVKPASPNFLPGKSAPSGGRPKPDKSGKNV